ncbi:MAG: deoxyuridine 5-triphosphate nucleotidohydrolase, dUTP pyrophosphatase [Candidatus Paceibacter sp.]|jgi:dUTP pyrophosphatase|nr:deoxyuridine 5-triphosphate nucleotidohydrolase, dUTP pyrophosphatase [Candidatus Paceibacter sp.]
MSLTIKIKKLHPDAKVPSFAHPGDAGMDLYATETAHIKVGEWKRIGTGIAIEMPLGYVGLIWDKSGLASNHGLTNLGGVIDAGYRGEYFVTLLNTSQEDYIVEKGHKIAQLLIQPVEHPTIEEVTELSDSSRGAGGFGSTGK